MTPQAQKFAPLASKSLGEKTLRESEVPALALRASGPVGDTFCPLGCRAAAAPLLTVLSSLGLDSPPVPPLGLGSPSPTASHSAPEDVQACVFQFLLLTQSQVPIFLSLFSPLAFSL